MSAQGLKGTHHTKSATTLRLGEVTDKVKSLNFAIIWWVCCCHFYFVYILNPLCLGIGSRAQSWIMLNMPSTFSGHLLCHDRGRPANGTGLKVLNVGLYKTGTTTVHKALVDFGLRTYSDIDVSMFLFTHMTQICQGLPATFSHAAAFTRCGVQAWTLWGYQFLMDEILASSPGVKVILTTRGDIARKQSFIRWSNRAPMNWFLYLPSSARVLPYGAVWRLLVGTLASDEFTTLLREGGPETGRELSATGFFYYWSYYWQLNPKQYSEAQRRNRKMLGHSSTHDWSQQKFLKYVRERVPAADLLVTDMHTLGNDLHWQELAAFLGMPAPPHRNGPLPRLRRTVGWDDSFSDKVDMTIANMAFKANSFSMYLCVFVWLLLHAVHIWAISSLLHVCLRCVRHVSVRALNIPLPQQGGTVAPWT
eukprot:gnl/TRDRNA2_/TRDRNA2_36896_c0_seq1.p1 gnl/TRDRNA2_/TRDRNA2_36896_c0~~gnl/TRDRNA2_/TRDRNA2_36896_c0_seq1.p1  ORF type:complete len:421 (+),score=29.91 gnl/TRDRNA2_/TRDRNA2_36896_c0_seq1:106-1368(+)